MLEEYITPVMILVFGFLAIYFLIDVKKSQNAVMRFQIEFMELMKIKDHILQPEIKPEPAYHPEPKQEPQQEVTAIESLPEIKQGKKPALKPEDKDNVKKAIVKLLDKL